MIVEVIGGADERPVARVVDINDLGRLHLALGEVTDEEAAEVLERAGLGRFRDGDTAFLDVAALRAAAEPRATVPDSPYRIPPGTTTSKRWILRYRARSLPSGPKTTVVL